VGVVVFGGDMVKRLPNYGGSRLPIFPKLKVEKKNNSQHEDTSKDIVFKVFHIARLNASNCTQ